MKKFQGPDFRHGTPRRIMGGETEYTIPSAYLPDISDLESIQPYIAYSEGKDDAWLRNGSRLYYDMPSDPLLEYASPECTSAHEAMIHEKAGEQIVDMVAHEVIGDATGFPIFKRAAYSEIVAKNGNKIMSAGSTGHHENYSTPLIKAEHAMERVGLTSYLATRPIWAGAGMVTRTGFELSQKNSALTYRSREGSLMNHGEKGITRLREDRIEVRSGDGNMSPWAIRTKYAMTSLVLRLLEHGVFPQEDIIADSYTLQELANYAAKNPRDTVNVRGLTVSPVLHQTQIAAAALEFANQHKVPDEERLAAEEVLAVCAVLATREPLGVIAEQLSDRIDWAAKLTTIRKQVGIRGVHLDDVMAQNLRAVQYDLQWETLGDNSPSNQHYGATGNVVDLAEVHAAHTTPPDSRARIRTNYIHHIGREVDTMYWTYVNPTDNESFPLLYLDSPYLSGLKKARHQLEQRYPQVSL